MSTGSALRYVKPTGPDTAELYSLNLWTLQMSDVKGQVLSTETQWLSGTLMLALLAFTLFIIFSFKNRPRQIQLARINYLLILALALGFLANAARIIADFSFQALINGAMIGLLLFVLMLYLNFRALMLIKKDEELVRSADRIR